MTARRTRSASGSRPPTGSKKPATTPRAPSRAGRPTRPEASVHRPAPLSTSPAPDAEVVEGEVVGVVEPAPGPPPPKPGRARPRSSTAPKSEAQAEEVTPSGGASGSAEPVTEDPSVEELSDLEQELGPGSTALVPAEPLGIRRDPLQAYMAEVRRHPLLTREEELALARKYRDTGDVRAAYTLVASNLRLVVKLAHEYHRNPLALLDLVQEGNIGLMQAVKKFDPERGVKLASYAAWWIRAYILRYIMDNWKMVKLGTTEAQRKLFFKLRQEQERLSAQGFEVTPKLLAERLNVTEQDVIEMDQRLGQDELSLDAPLGNDDGKETRADRLLSTAQPPADEALGNEELKSLFRERLRTFSETLTDKERLIFEQRLIADEPLTLQELGSQWGVSRERARQIEASLIARMRAYMRSHIPDFDLVASEEPE